MNKKIIITLAIIAGLGYGGFNFILSNRTTTYEVPSFSSKDMNKVEVSYRDGNAYINVISGDKLKGSEGFLRTWTNKYVAIMLKDKNDFTIGETQEMSLSDFELTDDHHLSFKFVIANVSPMQMWDIQQGKGGVSVSFPDDILHRVLDNTCEPTMDGHECQEPSSAERMGIERY